METGISRMYEGLFITGSIYLSDYPSAIDFQLLKSLNISAVLTVAKQFKINYPESIIPQHLSIPAIDCSNYDIQAVFDSTFDFIERVHQSRNVLIHCAVGVSRSASVFIAYLIRKHGYSLSSAFTIARRKRPTINPNPGFIRALQNYSEKHSSTGNASKQDTHYKTMTHPTKLKKKLSLHETTKQSVHQLGPETSTSTEQAGSVMSARSARSEVEDMDNLSRVLQNKQRVEQKLRQLQSYYRGRHWKDKQMWQLNSPAQFSSCFQTRKDAPDLFLTFGKIESSQL